ncbi:MAG: prohibitin family protein [Candidatus Altiarchaeota archaeon]|nr:prohibitin family protein [Candidatus Altiarchaeota archaeon]
MRVHVSGGNDLSPNDTKVVIGGFLGMAVLILLFTSIYTIDQTELGVVTRFGEYQTVAQAGLNFKIPIIDRVYTYEITQMPFDFSGNDALVVLTADGLDARIDMTVITRLEDPEKVYKELGRRYGDWFGSKARGVARLTIAEYKAESLYTEAREELELDLKSALSERVEGFLIIEDVLIRDVGLPQIVTNAIQNKIKSLQESQQAEYELVKARIIAQKRVVEAEAEAQAIQIVKKELTKDYLTYEYITQIAGSENSKIYVLPQDVDLIIGE